MWAYIKKAINSNLGIPLNSIIGSDADAASATGSAHGKLKDIKSSVGSDADAASATGSLHAKLKDLRSNNYGVLKRLRLTSASSTTTTLLNISGSPGYISGFRIYYQNYDVDYKQALRITKDGEVIYYMVVNWSGAGHYVWCEKPINGEIFHDSSGPFMLLPNVSSSDPYVHLTAPLYTYDSTGRVTVSPTISNGGAIAVTRNDTHVPFLVDEKFHFKESFKVELVRLVGSSNVSFNCAIDYVLG